MIYNLKLGDGAVALFLQSMWDYNSRRSIT